MNPFFNTPARIEELARVAKVWLGTPFHRRAAILGAGVDCVHLCAAIYERCGALPPLALPDYTLDAGHHRGTSLVEEFIATMPGRLVPVPGRETTVERDPRDPQPSIIHPHLSPFPNIATGDLLCLHVGRVTHHCAVYLGAGKFIHAIQHHGVIESTLFDPTFGHRLRAVYRVMEPA